MSPYEILHGATREAKRFVEYACDRMDRDLDKLEMESAQHVHINMYMDGTERVAKAETKAPGRKAKSVDYVKNGSGSIRERLQKNTDHWLRDAKRMLRG